MYHTVFKIVFVSDQIY